MMAKATAKARPETPDLLSAVFSLAGALILLDDSGRVRMLNGASVRLLGRSAAGEPFTSLCRSAGKAASFLENLKNSGTASADLSLVSVDGSEIPARVKACEAEDAFLVAIEDQRERRSLDEKLKDAAEELRRRTVYQEDFSAGVFRMLKDLDSSEQELERSYDKLKETQDQLIQSSKMTALGELAAGVAHELNQPLTVIKGLSQNILRNIKDTNPPYEKLRLIADACKKMELVIKHLRIFSRTDGPALERVDLNKTIKDAFVIVNELLSKSGVEVEMSLSGIPAVLGSPNRLEQVVINLVTNARDAMPRGGKLFISTGVAEGSGGRLVRMSFRDTGCGIPKSVIGRIFDPFFTTKEVGKGTGLGLSISYGITKEHNGEITVESEVDRGTVFHITLPAAGEARG